MKPNRLTFITTIKRRPKASDFAEGTDRSVIVAAEAEYKSTGSFYDPNQNTQAPTPVATPEPVADLQFGDNLLNTPNPGVNFGGQNQADTPTSSPIANAVEEAETTGGATQTIYTVINGKVVEKQIDPNAPLGSAANPLPFGSETQTGQTVFGGENVSAAEAAAMRELEEEAQTDGAAAPSSDAYSIREDVQTVGARNGLNTEGLPLTEQERADYLNTEQGKQEAFEQENERRIKELEDLGLAKAAEAARRSVSGVSAGNTRGTGATTSGQAGLSAAFQLGSDKIIDEATKQIELARLRRAEALRKAAVARKNEDWSLAATMEAEARKQEVAEKTAQADAEERINKIDIQDKAFAQKTLGMTLDMPATALAGYSVEALGAVLSAGGMPAGFAQGIITNAKNVSEAEAAMQKSDSAMNAMNLKNAEATYLNNMQSLKTGAQKNVDDLKYYQDELDGGRITQDQFDYMTAGLGAGAEPLTTAEELANTEKMREIYGDVLEPNGSNEGITSTINEENELIIDTPDDYTTTGRYSSSFPGNNGIECGEFVNDFWGGTRVMGDTFEQKMSLVDKTVKTPIAGMAFVIPSNGTTGHTGIVTKVYGNGMIKVKDYNKDGRTGQAKTYDMSISSVLDGGGFAINPNAKKSEKGEIKLTTEKLSNLAAANIIGPKYYDKLTSFEKTLADNNIKTKKGAETIAKALAEEFIGEGGPFQGGEVKGEEEVNQFIEIASAIGFKRKHIATMMNAFNDALITPYIYDQKTGEVRIDKGIIPVTKE